MELTFTNKTIRRALLQTLRALDFTLSTNTKTIYDKNSGVIRIFKREVNMEMYDYVNQNDIFRKYMKSTGFKNGYVVTDNSTVQRFVLLMLTKLRYVNTETNGPTFKLKKGLVTIQWTDTGVFKVVPGVHPRGFNMPTHSIESIAHHLKFLKSLKKYTTMTHEEWLEPKEQELTLSDIAHTYFYGERPKPKHVPNIDSTMFKYAWEQRKEYLESLGFECINIHKNMFRVIVKEKK